MATKSIIKNVNIKGRKQISQLVSALEHAHEYRGEEVIMTRAVSEVKGEKINKFFENSLNVSETSRQLYIHRNTLVYRLDKLQKSTGLDLRVFEDAITFKIALMVVKYMKYMESMDY